MEYNVFLFSFFLFLFISSLHIFFFFFFVFIYLVVVGFFWGEEIMIFLLYCIIYIFYDML